MALHSNRTKVHAERKPTVPVPPRGWWLRNHNFFFPYESWHTSRVLSSATRAKTGLAVYLKADKQNTGGSIFEIRFSLFESMLAWRRLSHEPRVCLGLMRTLQDLVARGWQDGAACVRACARKVHEDPMRVWGRAVEFRQVGVCGQLWRNLAFPCEVTAERAAQTPPRLLLGRCKGRGGEEKSPFHWVGPYKIHRSHKETARILGGSNKFCSLIAGFSGSRFSVFVMCLGITIQDKREKKILFCPQTEFWSNNSQFCDIPCFTTDSVIPRIEGNRRARLDFLCRPSGWKEANRQNLLKGKSDSKLFRRNICEALMFGRESAREIKSTAPFWKLRGQEVASTQWQ